MALPSWIDFGIVNAVVAYGLWGVFPIYWKQLQDVPAVQLSMHRIVWSLFVLLAYIFATRQWTEFRRDAFTWRNVGIYASSAIFIAANWFLSVWAVNAGYIVESSLGFFISPVITVLIGVIFFKEKLPMGQLAAIVVATAGMLVLAISYGKFPWISLSLALSFAGYGFVKKQAPLSSMQGLTLETIILFLPALIYLIVEEARGEGAFLHVDAVSNVLLVGSGVVTAIPLLLFSAAAKQIPLSTLGLLQYISPILEFLCGVVIYHEEFSSMKLVGFIIVWTALAIFSFEGIYTMHQARKKGETEPLVVDAAGENHEAISFHLIEAQLSPSSVKSQSSSTSIHK
ncbi:hypothetical protein LEN26_009942 [Aphanomyces euteiches]|nr:hypothetical protein LEN26_009942 [Aphanomyces euteiches]